MKNYYFNVEIDGQDNFAVINLGEVELIPANIELIKSILEPKLIAAISEHYDTGVTVTYIGFNDVNFENKFEITVALESDNDERVEGYPLIITEVELTETWVY